ncbi:hypothetical protein BAUCODRAFT_28720, partial [Baudoinia panamericana UAMH 10762]
MDQHKALLRAINPYAMSSEALSVVQVLYVCDRPTNITGTILELRNTYVVEARHCKRDISRLVGYVYSDEARAL